MEFVPLDTGAVLLEQIRRRRQIVDPHPLPLSDRNCGFRLHHRRLLRPDVDVDVALRIQPLNSDDLGATRICGE